MQFYELFFTTRWFSPGCELFDCSDFSIQPLQNSFYQDLFHLNFNQGNFIQFYSSNTELKECAVTDKNVLSFCVVFQPQPRFPSSFFPD